MTNGPEYEIIYITIEKQTTKDYIMKITIEIDNIFRKVGSRENGWVYITQNDLGWTFGKSLETKDLQEIVQKIKKTVDKGVKV